MAKKHLLGSGSFAHLMGFARAEDDKPKDPKTDSEGPDPEDVDEEREKREDETEEEWQARLAKLDAKAKEEDEDDKDDKDDEKDKSDAKATAARRRERSRCAAIFASDAARKRPDMAAYLAFGTDLSRLDAINALKASALVDVRRPSPPGAQQPANDGAAQATNLRNRMAVEPRYDTGNGGAPAPAADDPKAFAERVAAADRMRRGLA